MDHPFSANRSKCSTNAPWKGNLIMYKKIGVCFLIIAMLIVVSACGKQQVQNDAVKPNETTTSNKETTAPNEEKTIEETEETVPTELMIEYSMPEGEDVEFIKENEEDQNSAEETQGITKPLETVPPIVVEKEECNCEYSKYLNMSPAEQEAYMNTFASPLDFIEWSKNALAEHEAHDTTVQASGGDLDLSDYIK